MPSVGVVDDRLEWTNFAVCLELIFQDVYCTLTVYTPETEQDFYPIHVKTPWANGIIAQ